MDRQQVLRRYRDRVVEILDHVVTSQGGAFEAVRDAVAAALAADRLIYVAGSGHSHLIAEEAFFRAGGIAAAQAILDEDLMLHVSASGSSQLERETGYAEKVLAGYEIAAGDVVFVVSNSGRNAYPIEMALAAKPRTGSSSARLPVAAAISSQPEAHDDETDSYVDSPLTIPHLFATLDAFGPNVSEFPLPVNALLDIGCPSTVISSALANELGLR